MIPGLTPRPSLVAAAREYPPEAEINPFALAEGIAAARGWAGRDENPFDPAQELGRYAEWDAGWLIVDRERRRGRQWWGDPLDAAAPRGDGHGEG